MRIKDKLRAIVLLPLLFFVCASGIEYWSSQVLGSLYPQRALIGEISRTTFRLVNLTYEYGITHGERAASQWRNQFAEAGRYLVEMPAVFGRREDDQSFKDLAHSFKNAEQLFAEILAFDKRQDQDDRIPLSTVVRGNMINRLVLELQSVLPLVDRILVEVETATQQSIRSRLLLTVLANLSLSLSLIALAFWLTRGIGRSLISLQAGVQTVAAGDLACRVNLEARDELGDLGRGFDQMTEKLAFATVSRELLVEESEERRLTEEALLVREAQLREAQRIARLGSWELDLTTDTLQWSDEIFRIFEIDQDRFAATYEAFLEAIHPEDREMVNQAYAQALKSRTPYQLEHRLLLPDGRIKFVHERGETHFAEDGRPLRSFGTVQDISERRQVEEEIRKLNEVLEQRVAARTLDLERKSLEVEEAQRALMNLVEDLSHKTAELEAANLKLLEVDRLKSMFIPSMSHELRTPLNSIIGFSSIVLGEWLGPINDEQKQKLAIVLRTGKHLLSLINDLIDISKIEAGKLESQPEEFDLFDLITEVVALTGTEIAAKEITLQVEAIHLSMHSDRRRLYQCLVNLLGNAAKFTRAGTITVAAALAAGIGGETGQEMVAITIRDTGIGIREEDLPKLFTSFVRLPLPEDMQAKGTGLGLYLVKKIATEILGGTVSVTSVHGQGSEFCLTVPARER